MSDNLTLKDKILLLLVKFSMLSKKAFLLMHFSEKSVYRALQIAIDEGLIQEHVSKKANTKKGKHTHYTITIEGLRYLKANLGWYEPWLNHLDTDISHLTIRGINNKPSRVESFVKMASAAAMMSGIGAKAEMCFLAPETYDEGQCPEDNFNDEHNSQEQTRKASLSGIVNAATRIAPQGEVDDDVDALFFYNSHEVKRAVSASGNIVSDWKFGRYIGMVQSPSKSVLLYSETAKGMSWNKRVIEREISAFISFRKTHAKFSKIGFNDVHIAVMVDNPGMFEKLFFNHDKGSGSRLFQHLYVIPATYEGLHAFKEDVMFSNEERIIKAAVDSGVYTEGATIDKVFLPLKDADGISIMLGFDMDIEKMRKLKAFYNRFPNEDFGILCYDWQIPYYRKVLPKTKYMTMKQF